MTPTELLAFLQEFYRERKAMWLRHQAVARHVGNTDFNNTYQYIVAREETQLSWLRSAIEELGGVVPSGLAEPALEGKGDAFAANLMREDAAAAQRFVEQWRPRIEQVTNARHRIMLRIVLGETLEHHRFFEQAVAGREDLLGRSLDAGPRRGAVMGARWTGD